MHSGLTEHKDELKKNKTGAHRVTELIHGEIYTKEIVFMKYLGSVMGWRNPA